MRTELPGICLDVEDHGEGVPVILLHGFPLSAEIWAPIRPAVEQAARLITPDQRGFGRSDKPRGPYTVDVLASDVLGLADGLGLGRFVLGGHSMGGYVALAVAAAHRERLAGLILVDTRAETDGREVRERRAAGIAAVSEKGGAAFLDTFVPKLVGRSTRRRAPRLVADLRAIANEVPDHVLIACLEAMRDRPDRLRLLADLDVPALVVVGDEDELTTPAAAREMAAALPRAVLAVIPSSGHTPSVERPIPTAETIVAFLRSELR
jgi:pimeloyl-ACP methyl ester carboxylesterase